MARFQDRHDAGRQLASQLQHYAGRPDTIVLGVPRGGIPVAFEVARALLLPLDVFVARKLGVPGHEEYGVGAVASSGAVWYDDVVLTELGLVRADLEPTVTKERWELVRRDLLYRGDGPRPSLRGKTAIVVDDGLATGGTMRVAVEALRQQGPAALVVATPVGARDTCATITRAIRTGGAGECICTWMPEPLRAVGMHYDQFPQVDDDDVMALLQAHATSLGISTPLTDLPPRATAPA